VLTAEMARKNPADGFVDDETGPDHAGQGSMNESSPQGKGSTVGHLVGEGREFQGEEDIDEHEKRYRIWMHRDKWDSADC
jgi:hypothetical protein